MPVLHNRSVRSQFPGTVRLRSIIWAMFLLATWVGGSLGQDQTQPPIPSVPVKPMVARLSCDQQVKFKLSAGKWILQRPGTSDLVLPLQLDTGQAHCRVDMPSGAVLQIDEGSMLTLSAASQAGLELELKQGAVLYYLPEGRRMRVTAKDFTALGLPGVRASESEPVGNSGDGYAAMGFVQMLPDQDLYFYNFSGRVVVNQDSGKEWKVDQGYSLRVPLSVAQFKGGQGSDERRTGASAPDAVGVLARMRESASSTRGEDARLQAIEDPHAVLMDVSPTLRYSVDELPEVGKHMSPWTPPPRVRNLPAPGGETLDAAASAGSSATVDARQR